jgi:hypothetical protein
MKQLIKTRAVCVRTHTATPVDLERTSLALQLDVTKFGTVVPSIPSRYAVCILNSVSLYANL